MTDSLLANGTEQFREEERRYRAGWAPTAGRQAHWAAIRSTARRRARHMHAQRAQGATLQEIADHHGISRQRVHQILSRGEAS